MIRLLSNAVFEAKLQLITALASVACAPPLPLLPPSLRRLFAPNVIIALVTTSVTMAVRLSVLTDEVIHEAAVGVVARGNELVGVVRNDAASLAPYTAHIIGAPTSHTPASGLVAALSSEDWHTRRAAALAVKALVIALGPRLDGGQVSLTSVPCTWAGHIQP